MTPACDVMETPTEYRLSFDMPGMKKEDVRIEIQNNQIVVSGERVEERKEGEGRTYIRERSFGHFERRISLPSHANADRIEAQFEDGVLIVMIPKSEKSKPRQIKIGQSDGSPPSSEPEGNPGMTTTPHPKKLKSTTQRRLPNQREVDREKLNRGNRNSGNPKKHDGQSDDRANAHRGADHDDTEDTSNDDYS